MEKLGVKRAAVLVGCNYPNTENTLQGCVNDVLAMRQVLIERFEFNEDDIQLLIDEAVGSLVVNVMPTGANMKNALANMIDDAKEGDVLYFHYSGHGTLIPSLNLDEPRRQDEAIVPCDFNLITDMDFRELVNRLPPKTTFTFLSDSCHSGGLIDQEQEQIGPSTMSAFKKGKHHSSRLKYIPFEQILDKLKQQTNLDTLNIGTHLWDRFKDEASLSFRHLGLGHGHGQLGVVMSPIKSDQGILLSGCQANETSADISLAHDQEKRAYGAFSDAVQDVLKENVGPMSNKELVTMARKKLHGHRFKQHPCLYCSDDNVDVAFLLQQP